MRAGVIDIGSSSIKLIIGEKAEDQIKILESLKNTIPIGKHAFLKGRISQEMINQTVGLLEKYKEKLKEYDVTNIRVIATTAVREAGNKEIFIDTVYRKTGFNIEVLNIGDVVYYIDSFLSLKLKKAYPIYEKNLLIAELGAGSLDISVMEKGYTVMNLGLPIGTLRLQQFRERIEGSSEETTEAVSELIENEILYLKKILPRLQIDDVILIDENYSSSIRNILPVKKLESNFFKFTENESEDLLDKLKDLNSDQIMATYKLSSEIADTIDGYATIVNTLIKLAKIKYIYILETSLPEALLGNILFDFEFSKEMNKVNQLVSVANFLCRKYEMDVDHSKQVARLSSILFNELKDLLGLTERDSLYLTLASYLHDIGKFISNRSHHKHSEYVISSFNLFRLTEEEIKIIACIARYHRKGAPVKSHYLYNSLAADKQILIQKLSSLLRIANALDSSHKEKVKNLEVKVNEKQEVQLIMSIKGSFALEKASFMEKKDLFEEVSGNKVTLVLKN